MTPYCRYGEVEVDMKKRHSEAEIAGLLDRAQEMTAQGKLQRDIAKALDVSVMTYHRWRKAHATNQSAAPVMAVDGPEDAAAQQRRATRELHLENTRLRRLVTDLLLEKMTLEERLGGMGRIHRMAARG
jgi:putative transposase